MEVPEFMIRRISLIIFLIVALTTLGVSFSKNYVFAAQPGQSCKKAESASGSLICTKVKTKLIWQLKKKQQTISTSAPTIVSLTSQSISIDYSASSRLPVKATSASPTICTIDGRAISLVTVGYCVIRFTQLGDSRFFSAKANEFNILIQGSNEITFTPSNSLLLSSNSYPLAGTSTAGLSLGYESLTPDICSTSESTLALIKPGLCKVRATQSGSDFYVAAQTVEANMLIQGSNEISFTPSKSLLLSSKTYPLAGTSTSGLSVGYESLTPDICSTSESTLGLIKPGLCTVHASQSGSDFYVSAQNVDSNIFIQGSNEISFTPSKSLLLSSKTYPLSGTSTSGLPLKYESLTTDICSTSESTLTLIKIGLCKVRALQSGSDFYVSAQNVETSILIQGSNQISFTLSNSLLLSTKTYQLSGTSTSGLSLKYESLTPDICSTSASTLTLIKIGLCKVRASQGGSDFYVSAQNVEASITISATRVTSDQIDVVAGFQMKAVYVIPSDGVDNFYDTNGYISGILSEGNEYLYSQLKLRIPVDKTGTGYDIQFLKSNLPTSYFLTASDLTEKLLKESQGLENPGLNRKNYMYFIDVDILINGTACGYANIPGISSVVAIGTRCTGSAFNFNNYAASSWPHELFHNFGVRHTPDDPCDLMRGAASETPGTCSSDGVVTIDKERGRYLGSSAQGQDILKLRVWEGQTDRADLSARCSLDPASRADGFNYAYCPTGTQTIGALKYCWSSFNSVILEEFVDGAWKSLGAGSHSSEPWGPNMNWKCSTGFTAPWKQLTVTTPGISLYRWMVNGRESEQFKVIWVR